MASTFAAGTNDATGVGELLRRWRMHRHLSQLELSSRAEVSSRHLSFIETGRSRPTPSMIMKLADHLGVPLRERNQLLLAGGFAPAYPTHDMTAPKLHRVIAAMRDVLVQHDPYPAVLIDRWWDLIDANAAVAMLMDGCAPHLVEPPVNVLRLSLHPDGLAARIRNLPQWRAHVLRQVRSRSDLTGDPRIAALYDELRSYPGGWDEAVPADNVVLPLRLAFRGGELSLFTIGAALETASDVTVSELTIETFYPADDATAVALHSPVVPGKYRPFAK